MNRKFEFQTESIREETISRIESIELSYQKYYFIKADNTIEQEVNESCVRCFFGWKFSKK